MKQTTTKSIICGLAMIIEFWETPYILRQMEAQVILISSRPKLLNVPMEIREKQKLSESKPVSNKDCLSTPANAESKSKHEAK